MSVSDRQQEKQEQDITKVFTAEEATHVDRPEREPWSWPELANIMTSDSYKVTQMLGLRAANGDPLEEAFAVTYLENLYRAGYAVVKLDGAE